VASGLNPQQTFVELMDAPSELQAKAERFEYNLLAPLFALNLVLKAPPRARAWLDAGFVAQPDLTHGRIRFHRQAPAARTPPAAARGQQPGGRR